MRIRNNVKFAAFALILTLIISGCQAATPSDSFTAQDKAEIVSLSLERALVDQEIPDYQLLVQDGQDIVLSTENIAESTTPVVPGYNILLLTPTEIQDRANAEGDFLHLRFGPFQIEGADKANVSLGNVWATAEDSAVGYLSGGGLEMVYERLQDDWAGEVVAVWMS